MLFYHQFYIQFVNNFSFSILVLSRYLTAILSSSLQIVKETIGVGVNEKAVLRFYKTALSFTSISIFPW